MILINDMNRAIIDNMAEYETICQENFKKRRYFVQEEICSLNAESVEHSIMPIAHFVSAAVRSSEKYVQAAVKNLPMTRRFIAPAAAKSLRGNN